MMHIQAYNPMVNTWDSIKQAKNFADHGMDFADLDEFFDGDLLTREDVRQAYGEQRFQSIGMLHAVALMVVWTPRGDDGSFAQLISARKAQKHEQHAWQARYQSKARGG